MRAVQQEGIDKRMKNIQLVIEYDGSRYNGWQKLPGVHNSITIQDKIEDVLSKMDNEKTEVIGAARTEAGVHATGQIANFKTNTDMKVYEIKHYLNRFLPRDIAILEALEVPERFHASFSAKGYIYQYKISIGEVPSVFSRKYNYYCFKKPNLTLMKASAAHFVGHHDFRAFSDNKRLKKSTERTIDFIDIYGNEKEILITVKGDDFWPYMVRILVGTLLETGLGTMLPEDMISILAGKDRAAAGPAAEAKGLFLTEVIY